MYFKRIEMHGFKSFAEPVTIEFDRGITCVVGPNGSGKSNISDAIRWVLGEQSPKMLRGGKMEDVIFAGTASRKSRGMAEVTLVIDNSTGILPIEYQEVAITRRMYRSGESEYAINNNQCRMRDIRELLMDTGIGVDGYSLIGQGKISEIISNKSDSIREIFEETAGIVSYRTKKAEAERKLASANTNMDRVNDIITEIEGRIGGLKRDSEKAEEYVGLRDRHRELEINITINNIEEISEKNNILTEDMGELQKEIQKFTDQRAEINHKMEEAKRELDNYQVLYAEKSQRLEEVTEEFNRITNESHVGRERINSIGKDIVRLEGEIRELENKVLEEEESSKELLAKKEEIDKKYKALNEKLEEEVKKHSETAERKLNLAESIDSKKNEIFTLHNKKSNWGVEKRSIENLIENYNRSKEDLLSDIENAKRDRESLENNIMQLEEVLAVSESTKEELEGKNAELSKEKEDITETINSLQREFQDIGLKIGQKTARKKTIEELEGNYDGYNSGVKFIMKEGLKGIEGVVAEIISVPEGYEVALETALGAMMQNVVCDHDKTAQRAIELLKNNKAGRLTFLPVNSIKSKGVIRDKNIDGEDGFMGYGVDCVEFDEKYRNIIEYLLGNVAIIDNMENAIALSKKGNKSIKYVTLEGEVINMAGAVTGGKYKNKTANILERRGEIAKLGEEIAAFEKREREIKEELEESKTKRVLCEEKLNENDKLLRQAEIEVINIGGKLEIAKKAVMEQEADNLKWKETADSIDREKEKAEKTIEEIQIKIEKSDAEIREIEESIEEKQDELDSMSEQIEIANEAITKARIEVSTCDHEKENVDNLVERIEKTLDELNDQKIFKENQLENTKLDKNALEEGAKIRSERLGVCTKEKESLDLYIKELQRNRSKCSEAYAEDREVLEEINSKTTSMQTQKYEIEVKQARLEAQLDNLKNKLWEDFEISYAQALSMKDEEFAMGAAVKENRQIKNRIRELGEVNVGAIKEYAQVKERYEFLTEQRSDIMKSTDELNTIISNMDKIIRERFKESFDQVVAHFEEVFVEFFGGGSAAIRLDNEDDPLNATIEIIAQPPGKQLKNINLMSGGEKTMTAIALTFAVLRTKPTPCCILDEVEAALDDHNIHVFANYLKKFEDIQFTLITHQKTTMEHADVMYGVTMPERGISKVFSLKMGDELPV